MFIVKLATASVCVLYGVYVYRVLRRAEYHDLHGLTRRWRGSRTDENGAKQPSEPQSTRKEESHD